MIKRIGFSLLLLVSVLFWPFWLSLILVLFGISYFSNYWEGIVIFFLSDLLLGVPKERFFNFELVGTLSALISLVLIELLKKKLKFYEKR